MARTVIIVGLAGPFEGEIPEGAEVWGCNRAYKHQHNLTRLYWFDSLDRLRFHGHDSFVEHVNGLGIPCVTKFAMAEVPQSRPYPLHDILIDFKLLPATMREAPLSDVIRYGRPYFTSSIAYMVAEAIYEGAEEIVVHRMQELPSGREYWEQKACINFWLGVAVGRGCTLKLSRGSFLVQPHPWEPCLYGYVENEYAAQVDGIMSTSVSAALRLPVRFKWSEEVPLEVAVGNSTDVLPRMSTPTSAPRSI